MKEKKEEKKYGFGEMGRKGVVKFIDTLLAKAGRVLLTKPGFLWTSHRFVSFSQDLADQGFGCSPAKICRPKDKLVWNLDKKGKFTFKSASLSMSSFSLEGDLETSGDS